MSDLIERQAVIDWLKYKWNRNADSLFYGIQGLPPAQLDLSEYSDKLWRNAYERGKRDALAERKMGEWEIYVISMFDGEGCKCSECGFEGVPYWDYCPHCGSYNGGENNG